MICCFFSSASDFYLHLPSNVVYCLNSGMEEVILWTLTLSHTLHHMQDRRSSSWTLESSVNELVTCRSGEINTLKTHTTANITLYYIILLNIQHAGKRLRIPQWLKKRVEILSQSHSVTLTSAQSDTDNSYLALKRALYSPSSSVNPPSRRILYTLTTLHTENSLLYL